MTISLSRILAFVAFVLFLIAGLIVLIGNKGGDTVELFTLGGLGSLALAHAVT
jgi:hypothetical protein